MLAKPGVKEGCARTVPAKTCDDSLDVAGPYRAPFALELSPGPGSYRAQGCALGPVGCQQAADFWRGRSPPAKRKGLEGGAPPAKTPLDPIFMVSRKCKIWVVESFY